MLTILLCIIIETCIDAISCVSTDGMQKFDYGKYENIRRYNSSEPPRYSLDAVTCPAALYWAENDNLSAPAVLLFIWWSYKYNNADSCYYYRTLIFFLS